MQILVTGATGLIGRRLIHRLLVNGHQVKALTRSPNKLCELPAANIFTWSADQLPPIESLSGCEAIIHLAGEGIADQRWMTSRKQKLSDSRILGTKNLVEAIGLLKPSDRPRIFIAGSAIGYYGSSSTLKDESSPAGQDFLADLCSDWEAKSSEAESLGLRTVILRTGLVLANEGGLLSKAAPVILGDGKQWMSWIHIEDMINFIIYALQRPDLKGPFNLTAPNPVTNKVFTREFAKANGFPVVAKAPAAVLKLILGEMSQAVLASQNVVPSKTLSSGFQFLFSHLSDALMDLIGQKSLLDNFFKSKQFIPVERAQVFAFFSKAENLELLTPSWLNFHITKNSNQEIEQGSLIEYKLKIHGIPVRWKTLISQWNPDSSFVDDQLKGPYKKWHHLHTFETVSGGTLISDNVTFQVPGAILGKLLLLPFIDRDVRKIFRYRQNKIRELYLKGQL